MVVHVLYLLSGSATSCNVDGTCEAVLNDTVSNPGMAIFSMALFMRFEIVCDLQVLDEGCVADKEALHTV